MNPAPPVMRYVSLTVRTAIIAKEWRARPDSQLKIPSTRTMSREMTITSINERKPDEKLFNIPAEFKKADFSENARKAQTQVLSLEPSSK